MLSFEFDFDELRLMILLCEARESGEQKENMVISMKNGRLGISKDNEWLIKLALFCFRYPNRTQTKLKGCVKNESGEFFRRFLLKMN